MASLTGGSGWGAEADRRSRTETVSPPPGVSSSVSSPPMAVTKPRAMARPKPIPEPGARSESRSKGSRARARSSAGVAQDILLYLLALTGLVLVRQWWLIVPLELLAGLVTAVRRRGDSQAFVQIEDSHGRLECAFFGETFGEFAPMLSRAEMNLPRGESCTNSA